MASTDFGVNALVGLEDEFQMSSEERIQHSLANPGLPKTLPLGRVNNVTLARIRYALANMAYGLEDEVVAWIRQVAADSPKAAVELYLELVQFSVPKIKAVAISQHTTSDKPARELTMQELQERLQGDSSIVSTQ